jgi:hypothetical protein
MDDTYRKFLMQLDFWRSHSGPRGHAAERLFPASDLGHVPD